MQKIFKSTSKSFWIILILILIIFLITDIMIIYSDYIKKSQLSVKEKSGSTFTENELINDLQMNETQNKQEWLTYQDEIIQFKYPADWIEIKNLPSNFLDSFSGVSGGCQPLLLQDKNNSDIILVTNQYKNPQIDYIDSCWVGRGYYSSESRSTILKEKNEQTKILTHYFSNNGKEYALEWYELQSDFFESDAYYFSIIYARELSNTVQPIFDKMLSSFSFVRQYKPTAPSEWKTYKSPALDFSFEYPADWGEITEKIEDARRKGVGDKGKVYSLLFSKKSALMFPQEALGAGQSRDFSAGRGLMFTDYSGSPNQPASVSSEITTNVGLRCYSAPIQYYPYKGVMRFNLPGKEISGVMIVIPILSSADEKYYDKIVSEFIKSEKDCIERADHLSYAEPVIAKEAEISDMLEKGINFDDESKINLDIFTRMRESAKILE